MRLVEAITAKNNLNINFFTQDDTNCHIIFTYKDPFRKQYWTWLFQNHSDNCRNWCFRKFPTFNNKMQVFLSSVGTTKAIKWMKPWIGKISFLSGSEQRLLICFMSWGLWRLFLRYMPLIDTEFEESTWTVSQLEFRLRTILWTTGLAVMKLMGCRIQEGQWSSCEKLYHKGTKNLTCQLRLSCETLNIRRKEFWLLCVCVCTCVV